VGSGREDESRRLGRLGSDWPRRTSTGELMRGLGVAELVVVLAAVLCVFGWADCRSWAIIFGRLSGIFS
jgi:hypothetical protein